MSDLWGLVWGKPTIDPGELADALEREAARDDLDYRSRLLIRDGAQALEDYWGKEKSAEWLASRSLPSRIAAIRSEDLGPTKFPSLKERLMERTHPDVIHQFLRDLGTRIHKPVRVVIGGSAALILQTDLVRATEDIDLVDEVPPELRSLHHQLDHLRQLYGLHLAHFQSHFLPSGWESRIHTVGAFGQLQVSIIDLYDVFLGKLFSPRDKDLADLRLLLPRLERAILQRRIPDSCASFLADPTLRAHAERNWYVLTGETLP